MELSKKAFVFFLLMVAVFSNVKAQKKINEGIITYTVTYELNADQLQFADLLPKEIACYFRGDSTAAITKQGGATVKGVSVFKTNYHSLLVELPSASKKIAVVLTPDEVDQEKAANPQLDGKKGTEKQNIDGYNCTTATVTDRKSGTTYQIWITNDIDMPANSVSKLVSEFGGVPVKFITFNRGIKINAEIKAIKETTIASGFFSASKDYEAMSFSDLMKTFGGGK